jgi:hypothetical protein
MLQRLSEGTMANDRPKLGLSGPQIIGGALAAASAAVAASWLGVAGTVLGAVVVSLVASIGSALYTHSLERSHRVIRESLPVSPILPTRGVAGGEAATAVLPVVATPAADDEGSPESSGQPAARPVGSVSWRTVGVSALASLALAAAVLTGFETFVGKPASSITGAGDDGGTTVSQLVGNGSDSSDQSDPVAPTDTDPTTSEGDSSSSPSGATQHGQPSQTTGGSTSHPHGSTPTTEPTEPSDSTGTPPTDDPSTPNEDGSATTPTAPAPTD